MARPGKGWWRGCSWECPETTAGIVKGIFPAPDIHEHFMIHNGYGKLRTSSRTTSTTLSTLRLIA